MKPETKKKLENFWYHHKIGTIIAVTFGIIGIVCAFQMANRTNYDLYLMYAGPANINISLNNDEVVRLKLESAIRQVTGEPKLECATQCFTYVPADLAEEYKEKGINYNANENNKTYSTFLTAVANGKETILLLTPTLYEEVKENGALASLEETIGYIPESSADGYGIAIGDTPFYKFFTGLSDIPADTVICLRNLDNPSSVFGKGNDSEKWDEQVEMFKKIIEFEVS